MWLSAGLLLELVYRFAVRQSTTMTNSFIHFVCVAVVTFPLLTFTPITFDCRINFIAMTIATAPPVFFSLFFFCVYVDFVALIWCNVNVYFSSFLQNVHAKLFCMQPTNSGQWIRDENNISNRQSAADESRFNTASCISFEMFPMLKVSFTITPRWSVSTSNSAIFVAVWCASRTPSFAQNPNQILLIECGYVVGATGHVYVYANELCPCFLSKCVLCDWPRDGQRKRERER